MALLFQKLNSWFWKKCGVGSVQPIHRLFPMLRLACGSRSLSLSPSLCLFLLQVALLPRWLSTPGGESGLRNGRRYYKGEKTATWEMNDTRRQQHPNGGSPPLFLSCCNCSSQVKKVLPPCASGAEGWFSLFILLFALSFRFSDYSGSLGVRCRSDSPLCGWSRILHVLVSFRQGLLSLFCSLQVFVSFSQREIINLASLWTFLCMLLPPFEQCYLSYWRKP